jgi:hypothetical protein
MAPFYALRFDKAGRSTSPLTQQHLIDALATGTFTDVYLFCHGWNNDWDTALRRYRAFISEYQSLRDEHGLVFEREYRPLLAGVFWPSAALVMPSERGPDLAGGEGPKDADAADLSLLDGLADHVPDGQRLRFYQLAEQQALEANEATELLGFVSSVFAAGDPDVPGDPGRSIDEVLASWATLDARLAAADLPASPSDFGATGSAAPPGGAEAAGIPGWLNPRNLVRALTVWQMKDRAGEIGASGVGPLLRKMLGATISSATRFHLIGHSYGARVLLVGLARPNGGAQPRAVNSLLLLQPAVNHQCFADRLPNGQPGGFRDALALVRQPVMSTFSSHDRALHDTFHLALRRGTDIGEIEVAADDPPSEYAALGGYGPRGFKGWSEIAIKDPVEPYVLGPGAPSVWALNGRRTITSHSGVINPSTAWALFSLAKG